MSEKKIYRWPRKQTAASFFLKNIKFFKISSQCIRAQMKKLKKNQKKFSLWWPRKPAAAFFYLKNPNSPSFSPLCSRTQKKNLKISCLPRKPAAASIFFPAPNLNFSDAASASSTASERMPSSPARPISWKTKNRYPAVYRSETRGAAMDWTSVSTGHSTRTHMITRSWDS